MTQPNGTPGPDQDAVAAEWAAMVGMADDEDEARAAKPASAPEDLLAASWADALRSDDLSGGGPGAATPAAAGQGGRALNQDEIDSLLGFDLSDDELGERTGIRAIINSALVSYERLPMLEIVFDRLVRLMTTSLRNFTSDNVEVSLDNISSIRFGDYLNSIPLPAILAVFRAEELDNYGLLTVDSEPDLFDRRRAAGRPARHRGHAHRGPALHHHRARAGAADGRGGAGRRREAFEPLTPVTFTLDRLETNPRFAAIARPANAAILVEAAHRHGRPRRPHRAAAALRHARADPRRCCCSSSWARSSAATTSGKATSPPSSGPPTWSVGAVLDEQTVSLGQVLELKVGSVMPLSARPDSRVVLRCGQVPMLTGRVGRVGERVVVQVDERLARNEEADADAGA